MFNVGDKVKPNQAAFAYNPRRAAQQRARRLQDPRELSGMTFIQGVRGIANGRAASELRPYETYEVEAVLENGGLRLKYFTFTVSPKHVVRV